MTHDDVIACAETLGVARPKIDAAKNPQLWECWRDRVLLAERQRQRGEDASEMIREAKIYGGEDVPERRFLPRVDSRPWIAAGD